MIKSGMIDSHRLIPSRAVGGSDTQYPVMASDLDVKSFLKDGKNGTSLLCQRCSSVILRPNLAVLTEKEVNCNRRLTNALQ